MTDNMPPTPYDKAAALLDALIETDLDAAERFIEARLARLALCKRLVEKKGVKQMTTDNMPPLPPWDYEAWADGPCGWTGESMKSYARAYAEQQTADLHAVIQSRGDQLAKAEQQTAELRKQRDIAEKRVDVWMARTDELRADAKRLDHLEKLMLRTQFQNSKRPTERVGSDMHIGDGHCSLYVRDLFGNIVESECGHGDSVRAAIDAALEREVRGTK